MYFIEIRFIETQNLVEIPAASLRLAFQAKLQWEMRDLVNYFKRKKIDNNNNPYTYTQNYNADVYLKL